MYQVCGWDRKLVGRNNEDRPFEFLDVFDLDYDTGLKMLEQSTNSKVRALIFLYPYDGTNELFSSGEETDEGTYHVRTKKLLRKF